MPHLKKLPVLANTVKSSINWFPGHMYTGMQAMIGKLNTVDCILEVHDARIPFVGRNKNFQKELGVIKPKILILNKSDLADLSKFKSIKKRLIEGGDDDVFLTDLSGTYGNTKKGYTTILDRVVSLVNTADRFNRSDRAEINIMTVGIPNVGKSTLINRLSQYHTGRKGDRAKSGATAGLTKFVGTRIRICTRPLIYSLDTPGVLQPGATRNHEQSMRLALCATINEAILDPKDLVDYLINFLNGKGYDQYKDVLGIESTVENAIELYQRLLEEHSKGNFLRNYFTGSRDKPSLETVCWRFVRDFRKGYFGRVVFD